jgi:hypothetical protein
VAREAAVRDAPRARPPQRRDRPSDRRAGITVVVARSFVVGVPAQFAAESLNRLEDWPRMNPTCVRVDILARDGLRTDFRFTSRTGAAWSSSHYAAPDSSFSFTEQHAPAPPLAALQIVRRYAPLAERASLVAEEVTAVLLAGREAEAARIAHTIAAHAVRVQTAVKTYLEAHHGKGAEWSVR